MRFESSLASLCCSLQGGCLILFMPARLAAQHFSFRSLAIEHYAIFRGSKTLLSYTLSNTRRKHENVFLLLFTQIACTYNINHSSCPSSMSTATLILLIMASTNFLCTLPASFLLLVPGWWLCTTNALHARLSLYTPTRQCQIASHSANFRSLKQLSLPTTNRVVVCNVEASCWSLLLCININAFSPLWCAAVLLCAPGIARNVCSWYLLSLHHEFWSVSSSFVHSLVRTTRFEWEWYCQNNLSRFMLSCHMFGAFNNISNKFKVWLH